MSLSYCAKEKCPQAPRKHERVCATFSAVQVIHAARGNVCNVNSQVSEEFGNGTGRARAPGRCYGAGSSEIVRAKDPRRRGSAFYQ